MYVLRELLNSGLVRRIRSRVRDHRDINGYRTRQWRTLVPESWRNRAFRANEERASGQSVVEVLPAHDGETISSHKAQHKLEQQMNQVRYQRYVASLDQLPEEAGPSGSNDVFGGIETIDLTTARQRSLSGRGAVACLMARPEDSARIMPASEFVSMGRHFLEMEEPLAVRYPSAKRRIVNTRHARTCHRAGAQVNEHHPLVYALSRTFKRLSICLLYTSPSPRD